ncbi:hypothetical protein D9M68_921400 [compost metagenome]
MIDVKQQRQQPEDQLLAGRQRLHGALQAAVIDLEKARAQLDQHLAVDTFVDIRANFLATAHAGARQGSAARLSASREVCGG